MTTKKKTKIKAKAKPKPKVVVKAKVKVKAAPKKKLSDETIGIFGGAFNPVHVGHLNAAMTVKEELGLDRIIFVPANKAPHRDISGPSPQDRLAMVDSAIEAYKPDLSVDDLEIRRGGVSFTVDTLEEFNKTHKPDNIFFILGADAFKEFGKWRDVPKLLKLANFIVISRPGTDISLFEEDLPEEVKTFMKNSTGDKVMLKTKRTIQLVELDDINVSSTDIRKRLRAGGDAKTMVPPSVLQMINDMGFYKRSVPAVKDYKKFCFFISEGALDRKALALKIYDMTAMNTYSDFSIICSATSTRHAVSIAENIIDKVKEEFGIGPLSFEGAREGQWVLIDYGAVVIHVFEDAMRSQYRIEELWKKCPQLQSEIKAQRTM